MEVEIRTPLGEDLRGIVEVYNHYVTHSPATFEVTPVSVEERSGWFAEHTVGGPHRLLVASTPGGTIQGWASTSTFRPRAAYGTTVESSVYCRPEALGKGLGSRLYASLFDSIRGERVERIVAGVTLPNEASVALHERFGFRQVGVFTRVGWKLGRFWDVAWFERPLTVPLRPTETEGPGTPTRAREAATDGRAGRPGDGTSGPARGSPSGSSPRATPART